MADEEQAREQVNETGWKDVFSFERKEAVTEAVIRALNSNGVSTKNVDMYEKVGRDGKKKAKLFGRSLTEEDQQRSLYMCRGKPYYLPRYV